MKKIIFLFSFLLFPSLVSAASYNLCGPIADLNSTNQTCTIGACMDSCSKYSFPERGQYSSSCSSSEKCCELKLTSSDWSICTGGGGNYDGGGGNYDGGGGNYDGGGGNRTSNTGAGSGNTGAGSGIVPCGHGTPCTLCHLFQGIMNLVNFGKKLLVAAAITAIVIAGIIYIVSSGTELTTTAKSFLRSALIGFAIFLGAWLLIYTIGWLFGAKINFTINCDTKSTVGTGGGPGGDPGGGGTSGQQCCVDSNTEGQGDYGKKENCSEPTTTKPSSEDCTKYCTDYGRTGEALANCIKDCNSSQGQKSCAEGKGTLATGSCTSLKACGATTGSSTCEATNNGCGNLGGNTNGCDHTSPALAAALSCMNSRKDEFGVNPQISSVTLNRNSDWCEKCVNTYESEAYCAHKHYSCHFGGRNCKGVSQAVDLVGGDMNKIASLAKACNFEYTLIHGSPVHVHASVNNSACGCH